MDHPPRVVAGFDDGTFYILHGSNEPATEREWDEVFDLWRAHLVEIRAAIVICEGPGPSAAARQRWMQHFAMRAGIPIAMVSDSVVARGVATALGWIASITIRTFPKSGIDDAARYLGADPGALRYVLDLARAELAA